MDWDTGCEGGNVGLEEGASADGSTAKVVGGGSLSESFLLKKVVMGGKHC